MARLCSRTCSSSTSCARTGVAPSVPDQMPPALRQHHQVCPPPHSAAVHHSPRSASRLPTRSGNRPSPARAQRPGAVSSAEKISSPRNRISVSTCDSRSTRDAIIGNWASDSGHEVWRRDHGRSWVEGLSHDHRMAGKFSNPRPKRKIQITELGVKPSGKDFADRPTSPRNMEMKMKTALSALVLGAVALHHRQPHHCPGGKHGSQEYRPRARRLRR